MVEPSGGQGTDMDTGALTQGYCRSTLSLRTMEPLHSDFRVTNSQQNSCMPWASMWVHRFSATGTGLTDDQACRGRSSMLQRFKYRHGGEKLQFST